MPQPGVSTQLLADDHLSRLSPKGHLPSVPLLIYVLAWQPTSKQRSNQKLSFIASLHHCIDSMRATMVMLDIAGFLQDCELQWCHGITQLQRTHHPEAGLRCVHFRPDFYPQCSCQQQRQQRHATAMCSKEESRLTNCLATAQKGIPQSCPCPDFSALRKPKSLSRKPGQTSGWREGLQVHKHSKEVIFSGIIRASLRLSFASGCLTKILPWKCARDQKGR